LVGLVDRIAKRNLCCLSVSAIAGEAIQSINHGGSVTCDTRRCLRRLLIAAAAAAAISTTIDFVAENWYTSMDVVVVACGETGQTQTETDKIKRWLFPICFLNPLNASLFFHPTKAFSTSLSQLGQKQRQVAKLRNNPSPLIITRTVVASSACVMLP
jgi:hypothetical protein